jgi:gluconate 2-dehydrogenase subunit 3-like protein
VSAVLAAVVDALVPEDELGPGALAAGVVDFVERALAGPLGELAKTYDAGLTALDELGRTTHGRAFAQLGAETRDALLAEVEIGAHGAELQAFFELVRLHTVHGMFADPVHGGNRSGAGWRLIGFPGAKAVFTERDQALDVDVEPLPLP